MAGKHHKKETIDKLKNRVISEETRAKLRKNHFNISGANSPNAKSVAQYSLDGTLIKKYEYARLATQELGIDLSSIIKCCKHKRKTAGGCRWEYC